MAIRILLLLLATALLPTGLLAKEPRRTMATRRIVSAQSFAEKRAKARESMPRKKKVRKNSLPNPKSHWGARK